MSIIIGQNNVNRKITNIKTMRNKNIVEVNYKAGIPRKVYSGGEQEIFLSELTDVSNLRKNCELLRSINYQGRTYLQTIIIFNVELSPMIAIPRFEEDRDRDKILFNPRLFIRFKNFVPPGKSWLFDGMYTRALIRMSGNGIQHSPAHSNINYIRRFKNDNLDFIYKPNHTPFLDPSDFKPSSETMMAPPPANQKPKYIDAMLDFYIKLDNHKVQAHDRIDHISMAIVFEPSFTGIEDGKEYGDPQPMFEDNDGPYIMKYNFNPSILIKP